MEQHIENPERAQCTASPVGVETDQDEGQGLAAVAGGYAKIGASIQDRVKLWPPVFKLDNYREAAVGDIVGTAYVNSIVCSLGGGPDRPLPGRNRRR